MRNFYIYRSIPPFLESAVAPSAFIRRTASAESRVHLRGKIHVEIRRDVGTSPRPLIARVFVVRTDALPKKYPKGRPLNYVHGGNETPLTPMQTVSNHDWHYNDTAQFSRVMQQADVGPRGTEVPPLALRSFLAHPENRFMRNDKGVT